jgi:hypothetical protein
MKYEHFTFFMAINGKGHVPLSEKLYVTGELEKHNCDML